MAKRKRDEDLLIDDELTAAFLGDDQPADDPAAAAQPVDEDWTEEENLPGQLAVDVYETKTHLVVQAPIAGINKGDLDVSISDNTLSIQGTRSSGADNDAQNYYLQECFWGQFSRSMTLPVAVKEDEIDAVLKDGVLTISFVKAEQEKIKKIEVK